MRQTKAAGAGSRVLILVGACLWIAGCGSSGPAADDGTGELRVERTIEGSVTTVRNLGGSEWGGAAHLAVELEIGVNEGDERYMFGSPYPFFATEDEILVAEAGDGRIRVYGFDGVHHRDFGKPGPGPGELGRVFGLLATGDDRVLVSHLSESDGAFKVSVFTLAGEHLEDWNVGSMGTAPVILYPSPTGIAYTPDGLVGTIRKRPETPTVMVSDMRVGFQRLGAEGLLGDPWLVPENDHEPATLTVDNGRFSYEMPVPYSVSRPVTTITPTGDRVWGYPNEYRFQIEHPDGTTTVIERVTDPVRVQPEEADYRRRGLVASLSRRNPDFAWDGSSMPETKPWYRSFIPDYRGRIWVSREGPAEPVEDCTEPEDVGPGVQFVPCWSPKPLMDVFDLDGSFLGSLERPEGLNLYSPFIRGDIMVAGYEDELGVWKVRVYRIVLPGQEDDAT